MLHFKMSKKVKGQSICSWRGEGDHRKTQQRTACNVITGNFILEKRFIQNAHTLVECPVKFDKEYGRCTVNYVYNAQTIRGYTITNVA